MGSLSSLYISQSYQSLTHLGTNNALVAGQMTQLQDGLGTSLNISFDGTNISSSGNIYAANITASVINTGSFVTTSSFNAYSQSTNTTINNLSASLTVTDTFLQSQINALDASGSAASLVALNAFTASQLNINSGYNTFTQSANNRLNNLESTSASVNISISNLNSATSSFATSITNLNTATASLFTSASLGLTTASFSGNTLTFTKGNGTTFGVVIPDVSGSTIPAGTISGSQQITNLGFVSSSITASSLVTASAFINTITFTKGDGTTFPVTITTGSLNYVTGSFGAFYDTTTQSGSAGVAYSMKLNNTDISDGVIISGSGGIKVLAAGTYDLQFSAQVLADTGSDTVWIWLKKNGTNVPDTSTKLVLRNNEADVAAWNFLVSANANDVFELAWQSNGGHTKLFAEAAASNYTVIPSVIATMNRVDVGGGTNLVSTSSFNSYTSSNDAKVNSLIAATASYATSAITASSLVTASFSGNTLTFTKGDASTFGVVIPDVSGSTINTGSFATTGSNVFTGDQTFVDAAGNSVTLTDASGSLMLVAKGFTSASAHMSSSAAGIGNFIFKTNSNTADTIISGSSNLFTNATAPTAGFKRYIGGSGNIMLNASNVAQISSSMAFSPTMNNNYFGGNSTTLTMRGPVSSSTYTISANNVLGTINIGSSDANHARGIQSGLTMIGNNVNGNTLNIIANQSALSSSVTINNNIIGGNTTLNLSSSAVTAAQNYFNSSGTITNAYYSSSVGLGTLTFSRNIINGSSNTVTVSGSLPAGATNQPQVAESMILGTNITFFTNVAESDTVSTTAQHTILSTAAIGSNIVVSGSSAAASNNFGSVFVGRYNAIDTNRAKTAQTIFAVGTGNSTTRKTGFLIDSGSNTFVEGTLNVSGSTSFNGAVNITGSLTSSLTEGYVWVGGAGNVSTLVATSSFGGGSVPAGTVSSSAQILGYNIFATTGSNQFNNGQIIKSTGGLTLGEVTGGSDNLIKLQSNNQSTLIIANTSVSSGYQSGSILQLTTATGSNSYGGSGSAVFQMDAAWEGNTASSKVGTAPGKGSFVHGFADNILFAKTEGFPNTPATSFKVDAASIELSGSIKMNTGSSGSAGIVSVGSGGTTVTNGLAKSNSIILATTQELGSGDEYPAVVSGKTDGSFTLNHNFGGSLNVAYLIINPL
jgi:hypothetical protein